MLCNCSVFFQSIRKAGIDHKIGYEEISALNLWIEWEIKMRKQIESIVFLETSFAGESYEMKLRHTYIASVKFYYLN